ncbi:MAG: hypothetical protein EA360_00145 [Balneolaceae bacterium]|nr:MAG: hypothetical protein EA360_00145 [Balneolaceae bacterium]
MKSRKYAVIGTGKTGSFVEEILGSKAVTFDESHPPTLSSLSETDIAIIFVPGSAAGEVLETVLESGIPAVWGTTGYEWPQGLDKRLTERNLTWVTGSNFSIGMNLVRKSIEILGRGSSILKDPQFHIHEIHHSGKQDAPSGTALSWREWLGQKCEITAERTGDVKGIHTLHLKTPSESIWLEHEAHSRKVFAEGAVWCADYLLDCKEPAPGFHTFPELFDRAFSNLL